MHTKTIKELSALLQGKQVSATELARHFLARAQASDLNARSRRFIEKTWPSRCSIPIHAAIDEMDSVNTARESNRYAISA